MDIGQYIGWVVIVVINYCFDINSWDWGSVLGVFVCLGGYQDGIFSCFVDYQEWLAVIGEMFYLFMEVEGGFLIREWLWFSYGKGL